MIHLHYALIVKFNPWGLVIIIIYYKNINLILLNFLRNYLSLTYIRLLIDLRAM